MKYWYEPLAFRSGYRRLQLLAPAHARAAVQTPSTALQERGLKEADGYFLADPPCWHLRKEEAAGSGAIPFTGHGLLPVAISAVKP